MVLFSISIFNTFSEIFLFCYFSTQSAVFRNCWPEIIYSTANGYLLCNRTTRENRLPSWWIPADAPSGLGSISCCVTDRVTTGWRMVFTLDVFSVFVISSTFTPDSVRRRTCRRVNIFQKKKEYPVDVVVVTERTWRCFADARTVIIITSGFGP